MRIHSLCLILCPCTFGSDYSLQVFGFAYTGRMGSVAAQPFSYLSRDNQIQVWALAGPLKDIHKGHSFESVAACLGSLSCWKLNRHSSLRSLECNGTGFHPGCLFTFLPLRHPHSMMLPLQVPFGKLQAGCHVSFTEEWLLSAAQGLIGGLLQGWLSFLRVLSP